MANPNPVRRLTAAQLARGRKVGVRARQVRALERCGFELAFAEASLLEGKDGHALRVELVARLIRAALAGKQWALTLCLEYLFGRPRASVEVSTPVEAPSCIPDVPPELRAELRSLRLRLAAGLEAERNST